MIPELSYYNVNGIRMRVATQGRGPLVLFCHGWPESWYSWRHQMAAVAAAGFRAAAPDMRGYGGTDAPDDVDQYTLLHLVGDMVALVAALGEQDAVIVGHDWGAPVAWHAALMRPDLFRAVVGMSVPYSPPGPVDLFTSLEKAGIRDFYIQYFQAPGVAEAELEHDVRDSLRRIYHSASGEAPEGVGFSMLTPGHGLLHRAPDPATLPAWLSEEDLDHYTAEFERTGFRGGLNWYRNITRNWALTGAWRDCPIRMPSLFVAGERDGVLRPPPARAQLAAFDRTLPGLRGLHLLPGAGHWIQRERPDEVSRLLLAFLRGL